MSLSLGERCRIDS